MVLLWDFYNTIAVRRGGWSVCILEIARDYGYDRVIMSDIRPLMSTGFPWHDHHIPHSIFFDGMNWWDKMDLHFKNVFIQLGVKEEDAAEMSKLVKEKYADMREWEIFEDAIEVLEQLKSKGFRHYIASNYDPSLASFVGQLGLSKYFEKVYTSAHVGFEKPNPLFYQHLIDDIKPEGHEVIMIGDNYEADIIGASALGIKAILVHAENTNNHSFYSKDLKGVLELL